MSVATMIIWGHALAALAFGALALMALRDREQLRPAFVVALALTALWALAVAGIGSADLVVRVIEPARDLAWLAAMYAAVRRGSGSASGSGRGRRPGLAIGAIYAVVAAVCGATIAITVIADGTGGVRTALLLQMMTAVAALVLAHHLAASEPASRGGLRLALLALGAMWTADLVVAATAYAAAAWPHGLIAARGLVMIVVGVALALAGYRRGEWLLRPSRAVAVRSISLAAIALYVVGMVLVSSFVADYAGHYTRLIQTALVAGATATLIGIVASPWLRAWVKVKIAKHLFDHRYDYRREWLRFTATLGHRAAEAEPLAQRVVRAIAELTDSPAGLLLVAHDDGLEAGAGWHWDGTSAGAGPALAAHLAATDRILDLDALRTGGGEVAPVPDWLLRRADAWAIVPLVHVGRLHGAVVLARPPVARALDWEDFDLLRVAGRQGASYLAEGRAAAALGEAQRFEEFNRRFAFIIHDVKNLVSQLTLVARNAERHADNPAFRADMIATLKDSSGRMSALLGRLSQHSGGRADPPCPTDVHAIVDRLARQRRGQHPVTVQGGPAAALVDPTRFEQIVGHLIQNAIEASAPDAPVTIAVAHDAAAVTVAVSDTGCGMTAAFVRDELFRPFASSKDGGFGIGAFEARQLAEAMGGTVTVASTPGQGTRFAVTFPAAATLELAA